MVVSNHALWEASSTAWAPCALRPPRLQPAEDTPAATLPMPDRRNSLPDGAWESCLPRISSGSRQASAPSACAGSPTRKLREHHRRMASRRSDLLGRLAPATTSPRKAEKSLRLRLERPGCAWLLDGSGSTEHPTAPMAGTLEAVESVEGRRVVTVHWQLLPKLANQGPSCVVGSSMRSRAPSSPPVAPCRHGFAFHRWPLPRHHRQGRGVGVRADPISTTLRS